MTQGWIRLSYAKRAPNSRAWFWQRLNPRPKSLDPKMCSVEWIDENASQPVVIQVIEPKIVDKLSRFF